MKNKSLLKEEKVFINSIEKDSKKNIHDKKFLIFSSLILALTIISLFFASKINTSPGICALAGGLLGLVVFHKKIKFKKLIHQIHWKSIIFLMGLFVIVGTMGQTGISENIAFYIQHITSNPYGVLAIILINTALISMILDNVAFVTLMVPIIESLQKGFFHHSPELLWFALLFGAVLGGLATPFNSVSVVGISIGRKYGYKITPFYYLKYSILVSSLGLLITCLYLFFLYRF